MNFLVKDTNKIEVKLGVTFILENFSLPVIPPNINLEEFIELPDNIKCLKIEYPEQEGSYESHFFLLTSLKGNYTFKVGYKNLDTNLVAAEKEIEIVIT